MNSLKLNLNHREIYNDANFDCFRKHYAVRKISRSTIGLLQFAFGCKAMSLNDRDRTDLLNFINTMRSLVALGDFEAQNLPSAGDMNKLRWDCGLESLAEQAIADCPENPPSEIPTNGVNYRFYGRNSSSLTLRNSIRSAVLEWTSIEDVNWSTSNLFDGNPTSRNVANMFRATTTAIGCSENRCEFSASAACVFSQSGIRAGTLIYTSGSPCKNDNECTSYSPAFCDFGLCVNAARPTTEDPI
ncbi:unnamed protein product [Angiostrongylus costaricensis]|uniref:SCP domain-containing protein n=1 Tax=Angiostrongylus costaricensis TaxID=334426 RepID=A0A0R3PHR6_ANGCS|nr:unnamed protein product [Angiostrongylus costaricensis]